MSLTAPALYEPAPTMSERLAHDQRNWEGERCHHGFAALPFGPDVWCHRCEQEEYDAECAVVYAEEQAAVEAALTTGSPWPEYHRGFGPFPWQGEPLAPATTTDFPF